MEKIIQKFLNLKNIFFVIILLIFLLSVSKLFFKKRQNIPIYEVKRENLTKVISSSGKVESKTQVDLRFQISGKIAWIGVQEGQKVKKWQAIASLDKEELSKKIERAMNSYLKQRWDFEQTYENYGVSGKEKDNWLIGDTAKRILEKSQFDLNNSVVDVQLAEISKKMATLISPIEGIVTYSISPVSGVNVLSTETAFTISDPNSVIFKAEVDEVDIGSIFESQKAKIYLDAYPKEIFEGEVEKISFSSIITRGGGTAFPVEISLPQNDLLKFKLGMNGETEIIVDEKEDVLVIPQTAVFQKDGEGFVYKVVGKKAVLQKIKTGLETDTMVEVLEGLNEKDQIVKENVSQIKQNQKIK